MPDLLTKDDVRGIIPPVVTPFTADEELDLPAFRAEIQYQLSLNGVRGLTIGGSTGEGHALELDEVGHAGQGGGGRGSRKYPDHRGDHHHDDPQGGAVRQGGARGGSRAPSW